MSIKEQTFNCECIDCGYKISSEKHCSEIKCSKCGSQMRRVERPGTGKENIKRDEKGRIIIAENVPIVLMGTIEGGDDE